MKAGVSGLGGVSGECTPESPAQAESPGKTPDQTPDQIPVRTGMVTGVSDGVSGLPTPESPGFYSGVSGQHTPADLF